MSRGMILSLQAATLICLVAGIISNPVWMVVGAATAGAVGWDRMDRYKCGLEKAPRQGWMFFAAALFLMGLLMSLSR